MKKMMFLLMLLLCVSWAVAQTGSSQSPSTAGSSGSSGSEQTVKGCLSGSSGNYMLTDSSGNSWQLSGDTSKLADHVGHEIEVKGSTTSASSTTSSGASGSAGMSGQSSSSAQKTLNVSSVKHISKTCTSGASR
ncbi:MAG TPA: hypothetical protein VEG30_07360 [Terriglobales bacterium]|nr:hypothetical protein [Terriglobales bacterium]